MPSIMLRIQAASTGLPDSASPTLAIAVQTNSDMYSLIGDLAHSIRRAAFSRQEDMSCYQRLFRELLHRYPTATVWHPSFCPLPCEWALDLSVLPGPDMRVSMLAHRPKLGYLTNGTNVSYASYPVDSDRVRGTACLEVTLRQQTAVVSAGGLFGGSVGRSTLEAAGYDVYKSSNFPGSSSPGASTPGSSTPGASTPGARHSWTDITGSILPGSYPHAARAGAVILTDPFDD